jgi:sulfoxide reductase heme-binding subunit YedZ
VHFALQKKLDIYEPTLMAGFLAWLLAYRALYKWRRAVGLAGLVALAIFATGFTMLFEALWYGALTGISPARVIALNFMFMFELSIRPAWCVLAASLTIIAIYLAAQWLRPRESARVKLYPAE